MTINLDEIEKALGEITQGKWIDPWETEIDEDFEGIKSETGEVVLSVQWHDGDRLYLSKPNSHLIANAPEWLRLLVDRVRKLERDKEIAEVDASHFCAGLCVHPRGVIGDDGGSACCPITGTRDALVDGKKVVL